MISAWAPLERGVKKWSVMEHTTTRRFFPALLVLLLVALSVPAQASVTGEVEAAEAPSFTEVAEASTEFRTTGRARNRAHNVGLAAKFLTGSVIAPGQTLSFNDTVGERSAERGFRSAPVIASGRIRSGMGGGVCQVSTTLHMAALEAGLEIVEHRTHSRPSSYAPAGLDATVAWGSIDYQVRNPYAHPVRVLAWTIDGQMHVRLESTGEVATQQVVSDEVRTLPIRERVVQDAALAAGEREVERAGREGVVARVTIVDAEGQRHVQRFWYAAAPRVVRVGA